MATTKTAFTNPQQIEILASFLASRKNIPENEIRPLRRSNAGNIVYQYNGQEEVYSVKKDKSGLASFICLEDPTDEECEKACKLLGVSRFKLNFDLVKAMVEESHPGITLSSARSMALSINVVYTSDDFERTKTTISYPISTIKKKSKETAEDFEKRIYEQLRVAIAGSDVAREINNVRFSYVRKSLNDYIEEQYVKALGNCFPDVFESKYKNQLLIISLWAGEIYIPIDASKYIPEKADQYITADMKNKLATYKINEQAVKLLVDTAIKEMRQSWKKTPLRLYQMQTDIKSVAQEKLGLVLINKYQENDRYNMCLFGKQKLQWTTLNATYNYRQNQVSVENSFGSLIIDKDKHTSKIKHSDIYHLIAERIKNANYHKCIEFLAKESVTQGTGALYFQKGEGVFNGPTSFGIKFKDRIYDADYKGPGVKASITNWRRDIHQAISEALKEAKEEEAKIREIREGIWRDAASDFHPKILLLLSPQIINTLRLQRFLQRCEEQK